jgi:pyruvate-formate lyase
MCNKIHMINVLKILLRAMHMVSDKKEAITFVIYLERIGSNHVDISAVSKL